ncbi:hypothetical protein FRC20_003023 [Serendipita sp. 405]|nr:hypothetical protein FRC20_003023 [Serendipita sp. 405]
MEDEIFTGLAHYQKNLSEQVPLLTSVPDEQKSEREALLLAIEVAGFKLEQLREGLTTLSLGVPGEAIRGSVVRHLNQAFDTTKISGNRDEGFTFLGLGLKPHTLPDSVVQYLIEGDAFRAAKRLTGDVEDLKMEVELLRKECRSPPPLQDRPQSDVAKYKVAVRAMGLAFDQRPFNITEALMKKEVGNCYTKLKNLQTPHRKSFFEEMEPVTVPNSLDKISVDEHDIYSLTGIDGDQPQLNLEILTNQLFMELDTENPKPPLQYCFQLLESKGSKWVTSFLETGGTIDKALSRLCPHQLSNLKPFLASIGPRRDNWADVNDDVTKYTEDLKTVSQSLLKQNMTSYHRIAIIGAMSHGKSTLINALIGEQFIAAEGLATTGWPLVIRHSKDCTEPQLEIPTDHFKPYLEAITRFCPLEYMKPIEAKYAKKRPSETEEEKKQYDLFLEWQKLIRNHEHLRTELSEYERNSYAFPDLVVDRRQINDTIERIGNLIRVCYLFRLRALQTDANWPTLTVSMKNIPENLKSDKLEGDVLSQWDQIISTAEGVIVVFKADKKLHSTSSYSGSDGFLSLVQSLIDGKPTIAIGTFLDSVEAKGWNNEAIITLLNRIWPAIPEEVILSRVATVSSKQWISAEVVSNRIQNDSPLDYDFLREGEGDTLMETFINPELIEIQRSSLTHTNLKAFIELFRKMSKFQRAMELIGLMDFSRTGKKVLPSTQLLLEKFRATSAIYQDLLSSFIRSEKAFEDAKKQFTALEERMANFTLVWYQRKGEFAQTQRLNVEALAEKAKGKVSAHLLEKLNKFIDDKKIPEKNGGLIFTNTQLSSLCADIGKFLATLLDTVQYEMLQKVRDLITKAWESRIEELEKTFNLVQFSDNDPEAEEFRERLCRGIREKVQNRLSSKVPIDGQLLRLINSRLPLGPRQPTKENGIAYYGGRIKAEEKYIHGKDDSQPLSSDLIEYLTGFSIIVQASDESSEGGKRVPVVQDREIKTELSNEDLAQYIYGLIGIMGRSPVLASAGTLGNALSALRDVFNEKAIITKAELVRRLTEKLIDPWHDIVRREWCDSLDGAIYVCSSVGMATIWGDMATKKAIYEKNQQNYQNRLSPESLKSLIIAEANCTAYIAALVSLEKTIVSQDKLQYNLPATDIPAS